MDNGQGDFFLAIDSDNTKGVNITLAVFCGIHEPER